MSNINDVIKYKINNSIFPFLWLHHESKEKLQRTIDSIYKSGIEGFCIESRPHPDFLGKTWWEDLDFIFEQAEKRGMKVWILDDSHFPTGYVAGRVPQALQKKFLYIKQLDYAGPVKNAKILLKYVNPAGVFVPKKDTDKILKVLIARKTADNQIDSNTITDITDNLTDNILTLDLPSGQSRIFVLLQTYDGGEKETENYLNPLIKEATEVLVNEVYEQHYKHYQKLFGTTILGFFSDEPRFGNAHGSFSQIGQTNMVLPWRDDMLETYFAPDYKLLPLLTTTTDVHHQEINIRYKYMAIVSKLYAENFAQVLQKWCQEHGVAHIGHLLEDNGAHTRLGYGAGHYFKAMTGFDMAGIDVVLNQIMPGLDTGYYQAMTKSGWNGEFFHYGLADLANSAAQLEPRKKRRSMVELFGAYGWAEGLPLMKYIADHMMVRGINHFVPHAFNSAKFPDPDCPPHFYADNNEPEQKYYPFLFKYINRVSAILSDSKELCQVAVLYHAENEWLDATAMPFEKVTKRLYQKQIPHELVTIDYLKDCLISENSFQINDHKFTCLIIPQTKYITNELAQILEKLSKNGIQVFFVNKLPRCDENLNDISGELAKAQILPLTEIARTVKDKTDIRLLKNNKNLRLYRFKSSDNNGVFFFNENVHQNADEEVMLSQKHDVYAFDPMTLKLELLGKQIQTFHLKLAAGHTCFILFDNDYDALQHHDKSLIEEKEISNWDLKITGQCFKNFDLRDVNSLPGFKNYSGKSSYSVTITIAKLSGEFLINLGQIGEVAELKVNGKLVGRTIEQNSTFAITPFLKVGSNKIEIETVNNLAIKIQDPESQFGIIPPAGLIGPVKLEIYQG